jgi:hypothetical protein
MWPLPKKLTVIMHQMWPTGEEFRWSSAESLAAKKHGETNEIRRLAFGFSRTDLYRLRRRPGRDSRLRLNSLLFSWAREITKAPSIAATAPSARTRASFGGIPASVDNCVNFVIQKSSVFFA